MPTHRDDELPSLDPTALRQVTGGADLGSMMLPLLMMRHQGGGAAAPAPAPAPAQPWRPRILVDGVEQQPSGGGNTFTVDG